MFNFGLYWFNALYTLYDTEVKFYHFCKEMLCKIKCGLC